MKGYSILTLKKGMTLSVSAPDVGWRLCMKIWCPGWCNKLTGWWHENCDMTVGTWPSSWSWQCHTKIFLLVNKFGECIRTAENRERWRRIVWECAVPQRSIRLRDRWRWRWRMVKVNVRIVRVPDAPILFLSAQHRSWNHSTTWPTRFQQNALWN